jgi:hypothetical protein
MRQSHWFVEISGTTTHSSKTRYRPVWQPQEATPMEFAGSCRMPLVGSQRIRRPHYQMPRPTSSHGLEHIYPQIEHPNSNRPSLPFQFENDDITSAKLNQDNIGWYPFLLGHLSHYWQAIQHDYFVSLGLLMRNTGAKWTAQLIINLFNTSWDMWEHRNGIKHKTLMPAKLRAIRDLDSSISNKYSQGPSHLFPKDKQWLQKRTTANHT